MKEHSHVWLQCGAVGPGHVFRSGICTFTGRFFHTTINFSKLFGQDLSEVDLVWFVRIYTGHTEAL